MLPENSSVMNSVECTAKADYNKILIEAGWVVINMFVRNFTFVNNETSHLEKNDCCFLFLL